MKKYHKILLLLLISMFVVTVGCSRGPSKKEIEQLLRNHVKQSFNFPTHLFPDKEYLDPKYIVQEETLKLEEIRVMNVVKSQERDYWRVKGHAKVSVTLAPKPPPGASWLRAYDHYEAPTTSKRIQGEGELEYGICRDEFGKWFVSP
jgi:hypothetical protein